MNRIDEYYLYIKQNISIKQLCDKFGIQTMQAGNDYTCSCIYHNDPHPSMHIYTDSKTFYCFECNNGGNIFTFLKQMLKCDFYGCITWLEKEYPYLLEKKPVWNQRKKTGYQIAYEKYKTMSTEEEEKFQIFSKDRGYSDKFLTDRGIFYAKGKKLYQSYVKDTSDNYIEEVERLNESQLLKMLPRQKGWKEILYYEDFCRRDCVIITLRDENGIIKGFAARGMGDDKPKYLFTHNLKKSEILYRMDEVKKHLKDGTEDQRIYITEGFFDALRLESQNQLAVAVLGSTLAKKQIKILENVVGEKNISMRLFLDSDKAGQKGTVDCISKIWKNKVLRRCYLDVAIIKEDYKDPDEAWKAQEKVSCELCSGFEFVMRYYMKEENQPLSEINIDEHFEAMNVEERISFLHKVEGLLPSQEWRDLFEYYDGFMEEEAEPLNKNSNNTAYFRIRRFILGASVDNTGAVKNNLLDIQPVEEKDYQYRMQTALQIARTSYDREEVCLDQESWDRIAVGADAYFEYLRVELKNNEKIEIPLFSMLIPKKLGVQRRKALYCHEELLIQQYVLNELLASGQDINYEKNVPAVRYRRGAGTYLTGYGYQDLYDEPLSFAYQVDMDVVNGITDIKNGMFRPFFDCWREYIGYIQDGIEKLERETVYRVKLDIQGFYDNVQKFVVRNALYESVEEAFRYDNDRFAYFKDNNENENLTENVVSWILDELFKAEYYDPCNGELKRKEECNRGIPQGPNLSAYIANISLFPLDKKVAEIIHEVNSGCEDGKIRARYARYVDDMIIIASTPEILLKIKGVIAAQLYDLRLNLSPKTEAEDGITKEEAYDWTTEERGGFGVSAGFDMADDSYEALMEDYDEYEITDRRAALRLLQSNMYALLYENVEKTENINPQLIKIFFQTEEIRYNDIVRFSEILIYYAAQKTKMLDGYEEMWEEGVKYSTEEALFGEDGLNMLVLLTGCIRIIKRNRTGRNIDVQEKWKSVEDKICAEAQEICDKVKNAVSKDNILGINGWALNAKIVEFCGLTGLTVDNSLIEDTRKNEYGYRWIWSVIRKNQGITKFKPDQKYSGRNLLQNFAYCLEVFMKMDGKNDYDEIKSQFQNYLSQYDKNVDNTFLNCIRIWFFDSTDIYDKNSEIALRVLLNTVPETIRAEIIDQINGIKTYVFPKKENTEFLPVYPGVKYPGIMRVNKSKSRKISQIDRIDFNTQAINMLDESRWKEVDDKENKQYKSYEKDVSSKGYIHLKDFCQRQGKMSSLECIELVCKIYFSLVQKITDTNKSIKGKCPDRSLILSSRNVLIKEQTDKSLLLDVKNAYLVSVTSMSNAVAVESGADENGRYILKNIYEDGKEYWISGYLLRDACNMDEVLLRESLESGTKRDAEMLDFSMRRLYGSSFEKYRNMVGKKRSYRVSIKRTIDLMKEYLTSGASERELCLENARMINSFIKERMDHNAGGPFDASLECAIWAKNYLRFGFIRLRPQIDRIEGTRCPIKRRVPKLYYMLADRLNLLIRNDEKYSGVKVLAAGLYADSVLMHLRMQVLECIFSFDREQRKHFLETAEDLPLEELGMDEKDMLISAGDIVETYKDLLEGSRNSKGIKKITHLGWIVLLAKVYEVDKKTGFNVFDSKQEIDRNALEANLRSVVNCIKQKEEIEEKKKEQPEFPFEDMDNFFLIWEKGNVDKIFESLCNMDIAYGTLVETKQSEDYNQRVSAKKVIIQTKYKDYEEQPYFLTYGKLNTNPRNMEHSIENKKLFVYTQTVIRGNVVGFSTIEREFGDLLQGWEIQETCEEKQKTEERENDQKEENESIKEESREKDDEKIADDRILHEEKEHPKKLDGETITEDKERDAWIRGFQREAWTRRGQDNPFKNSDRIALFQFRIDSSYKHPMVEACQYMDHKESVDENGGRFLSCAEYRRRELLEPVMETCKIFRVDILLLPEYSIRPETVEWMRARMEKEKYNFSVWAGTFRVPADYWFDERTVLSGKEMNNKVYWHSAPLPVITLNEENIPEIVLYKFKKYPSVALKEDINPAPAYGQFDSFRPVMDRYLSNLKTGLEETNMARNMLGDARDDVLELICAELFAVSSISNYPSFLQESLKAYAKYSQVSEGSSFDILKKPNVYMDYIKKYLQDIRYFGDYTAIYQNEVVMKQHENRSIRRPILLVPACTTRAVDYYVFGQGFYLSAGLKIVFCNAVGTGGRGGSCFIGPDSWDDNKKNKDPFLEENTLYHGLKPGIYMQTSDDRCRGALGKEEQALLICDIYPHLDKGNPNAESMMSAFSLVAHIPVFEDRNYGKGCKKCDRRGECSQILSKQMKEYLNDIEKYCNIHKEDGYTLSWNDVNSERPENVEKMRILGEYYHSEWFVRRAEYYDGHRILYPQAWPPPTLTDWLYVETDYEKLKNGQVPRQLGDCRIQIPMYEEFARKVK